MATYRKAEYVSWKKQGTKGILLDLNSGRYYTLNETATAVWEQFTSGVMVDDVIQHVARMFGTDSATVRNDVCELVDVLVKKGLLCESNISIAKKSDENSDIKVSNNQYVKPMAEEHETVKELTAGSDEYDGGGSTHYWYPN